MKERDTRARQEEYRELKRKAKAAVLECMRKRWHDFSLELEQNFRAHQLAPLYAKIRFLQRSNEAKLDCLLDKDERVIQTIHGILMRWHEHFEALFEVNCEIDDTEMETIDNFTVPGTATTSDHIPSLEEVRAALFRLKNRKAAGMDGIPVELLKHGGESTVIWLHAIICKVWETERAPKAWKEAALVPLHKKGDPRVCDNYRGISLLSVPGKVYARVLLDRINHVVEQRLLENQCGFRPGRSCVDHIFSLRQLMEKSREWKRPLYVCFIDLRKAYDSVNRDALWRVLKRYGISDKLLRLIADLHTDTRCKVRVNGEYSDWFDVKNGVRQGCVLAPTLFNVFIDFIVRVSQDPERVSGVEIKYRIKDGLMWHTAANLRDSGVYARADKTRLDATMYADDISLVSDNPEILKAMIMSLETAKQRYGMCINTGKTKILAYAPPSNPAPDPVVLRGDVISCESNFRYLGSILRSDCGLVSEITQRIASASRVFYSLYPRLWKRSLQISLATKVRIYETLVLSILLYASETWAIPQMLLQRLEVFHMRCLRIILGVTLWNRIPNAEILRRTKQKSIEWMLCTRRLVWFGHCVRMDPSRIPVQVLFSCLPAGERGSGRPLLRWCEMLNNDLSEYHLCNWRRTTEDREKWRASVYGRKK